MATATAPGSRFGLSSRWLIAALAAAFVVGGGLGAGLTAALLPPRLQPVPPATSPTPSPSPSPSATSSQSPSPAPSPVSVVAGLKGRIAVSTGSPGSGGWIAFPSGTSFSTDPGSNVTLPGGAWYGLAYVTARKAWVPVPARSVTPDGSRYVYFSSGDNAFHVVRQGAADVLLAPPSDLRSQGGIWSVLSVENSGAYVTSSVAGTPNAGLYWVPFTGTVRQVTSAGYWTASDARYAYGTLNLIAPRGAGNTITRLDLTSGGTTSVFARDGVQSKAIGVDRDGNPIVLSVLWNWQSTMKSEFQIWVVRPAGPVSVYTVGISVIYAQTDDRLVGRDGLVIDSVMPDTMGTWISMQSQDAMISGIYLLSLEAGLERASPVTGSIGSTFEP